MKKNKKMKKILPAFLACLTIVGASAWLTNKETATGLNHIKPGVIGIEFVDLADNDTREQTKIELSGNEAIPMTAQYAIDNLDPYKFSIENTGDFDLNYTLYIVVEENTFGDGAVHYLKDAVVTNVDENTKRYNGATINGTKVAVQSGSLAVGKTVDFDNFRFFLDQGLTTEQCTDKKFVAHLEVEATQSNVVYEHKLSLTGDTTVTVDASDNSEETSVLNHTKDLQSAINDKGGPAIVANASSLTVSDVTYAAGIYYMDYEKGFIYQLYKDDTNALSYDTTVSAGTTTLIAKKVGSF